jgi:hypothetical protein
VNDRTQNQQRGWCTPGEEKTWYLESNNGEIKEPKFSDSKVCESNRRTGPQLTDILLRRRRALTVGTRTTNCFRISGRRSRPYLAIKTPWSASSCPAGTLPLFY